jgi:hypothetical protein
MTRLKTLAPALLAAAAALVAALVFSRPSGLPLDDAYIHLTFAKNLGRGLGLCFNPGEFSLGFTSLTWVALLALASRVPLDPIVLVKVIGGLALAGSAALMPGIVGDSIAALCERLQTRSDLCERLQARSDLCERLQARSDPAAWSARTFSLAAALGLAVCGNLLWIAGAGMESMLYLFLGLLAIRLLYSDSPRPIAGGAALGLLILTRPTGAALALVVALAAAGPRRRQPLLIALAVAAALNLPWIAYVYAKTGHLLPTTHAGKLASNLFNAGLAVKGIRTYLTRYAVYLYQMDRGIWLLLIIAFSAALASAIVILVAPRVTARPRPARPLSAWLGELSPAAALGLWAAVDFAQYALCFRSTYALTPYHNLRYQVMLIPAVIAAAAVLLPAAASRLSAAAPAPSGPPRPGVPLIYVIAFALFVAPLAVELIGLRAWATLYTRNTEHLQQVHRAAADWARDHTPPAARIAVLDIGMLGYYSGRHVIDLGGLIDPQAHPYLRDHHAGRYMIENQADYYFAMVRPDSEVVTGIMADNGRLYRLAPLETFNYPAYAAPVTLHSLGVIIYRVEPPGAPE